MRRNLLQLFARASDNVRSCVRPERLSCLSAKAWSKAHDLNPVRIGSPLACRQSNVLEGVIVPYKDDVSPRRNSAWWRKASAPQVTQCIRKRNIPPTCGLSIKIVEPLP